MRALVFLSDIHCGSTVGLMHPDGVMHDDGLARSIGRLFQPRPWAPRRSPRPGCPIGRNPGNAHAIENAVPRRIGSYVRIGVSPQMAPRSGRE